MLKSIFIDKSEVWMDHGENI